MPALATCLWFDGNAEEAAKFYTSVFKNSRILHTAPYTESSAKSSGQPLGSVMAVTFELDGRQFMGLNGGPHFQFSPAVSIMVYCDTQEEIDYYWEKLTDGGQEVECGWLTDRFGLSWQIVPSMLARTFEDRDPRTTDRVMAALLTMKKLDIATLQKAYDGK